MDKICQDCQAVFSEVSANWNLWNQVGNDIPLPLQHYLQMFKVLIQQTASSLLLTSMKCKPPVRFSLNLRDFSLYNFNGNPICCFTLSQCFSYSLSCGPIRQKTVPTSFWREFIFLMKRTFDSCTFSMSLSTFKSASRLRHKPSTKTTK